MPIAKEKIFFITLALTREAQRETTRDDLRRILKDGLLRAFERHARKRGWKYKIFGCIADVHCSEGNFDLTVDALKAWSPKGRINAERSLSHSDIHVHLLLYCSAGESGRKKIVEYWEKKKLGYAKFHGHNVNKTATIRCDDVLKGVFGDERDCLNRLNYIEKNYKYSCRNHRYKFRRENERMSWLSLYYKLYGNDEDEE